MSEQAIETEDEIQTDDEVIEEVVIDAAAEESEEEVEIVVDGEVKPASKSQRPSGFKKRVDKLNGKIDAANTNADEATRRAEMLEEENKLLRLQQTQANSTATRPDIDDFETTAEYNEAVDKYDGARIAKAVDTQVAEFVQQSHTQNTQVNNDAQFKESLGVHYERADTLKMKNYEELEDKAIDVLGNDFSRIIMAKTEKSHLIMAHLGANRVKADELSELVKVDPVMALVRAVEIGNSLSVKPKTSPPDPETKLESGAAVSDWQKRIDTARDKAAASGDMKPLIALKKQAKEAGIK